MVLNSVVFCEQVTLFILKGVLDAIILKFTVSSDLVSTSLTLKTRLAYKSGSPTSLLKVGVGNRKGCRAWKEEPGGPGGHGHPRYLDLWFWPLQIC